MSLEKFGFILYFNFLQKIFRQLKVELQNQVNSEPNFSKDRIRQSFVLFSAFFRTITATKSNNSNLKTSSSLFESLGSAPYTHL